MSDWFVPALIAIVVVYTALWSFGLAYTKRGHGTHIEEQETTSNNCQQCDCLRRLIRDELQKQENLRDASEARGKYVNRFKLPGHGSTFPQRDGDKERRDHLSEQGRNVRVHESPSPKNAPAGSSGEGETRK